MFALSIVAESDFVCALPRRFAAMYAARFDVASFAAPLPLGNFRLNAVAPQAEKRFDRNLSLRASYTLAYSHGNTSGSGVPGSGFQVLDDLRLDLNEGPTNFDRRHNFSGEPFSLFNGDDDPDRNGSTSEPLDAGTDAGTVGKTPTPSRPGRANATGQRV